MPSSVHATLYFQVLVNKNHFNPFQPATRRQGVKKYFCEFLLLLVDGGKKILFFKIKNCFLYRMTWCIHLDTSGHEWSKFHKTYFPFSSITMQYFMISSFLHEIDAERKKETCK